MITLYSCDDSDESSDIEYSESITQVKEVSVQDMVKVNQPFSIRLTVYGSSGCSFFSRHESTNIGDTLLFKVYQKRDRNAFCTQQIVESEANIEISINKRGKKFLKFNEGGKYPLVDSIYVVD